MSGRSGSPDACHSSCRPAHGSFLVVDLRLNILIESANETMKIIKQLHSHFPPAQPSNLLKLGITHGISFKLPVSATKSSKFLLRVTYRDQAQ